MSLTAKVAILLVCALVLILLVFQMSSQYQLMPRPMTDRQSNENQSMTQTESTTIDRAPKAAVIEEVVKQVMREVAKKVPVKEVVKEMPMVQEPPVDRIPSREALNKMSHAEVQKFYHEYVNSPQVTCSAVVRMGLITDGGWEHCDDPRFAVNRSNCLVYSYGINFDFSYDDDMATFGCEVHAFDPSMKTAPHLRGQRVHFHNTGVAASDHIATNSWQLYSIATQRKNLNHSPGQRRVDVVKMDVDLYELESLPAALDAGALDDVRQLNFESHVSLGKQDPPKENYIKYLEMFRKIYDHGFRIYLTHRNYVWSSFLSRLFPGKKRVTCHEVHTVNINHINPNWQEKQAQKEFSRESAEGPH